ncbi:MAG TPA: sugar ABC transporter permease [Firmicutes bacterium]|nr:sugar ABC transporter permease [Bacillota bacterium]
MTNLEIISKDLLNQPERKKRRIPWMAVWFLAPSIFSFLLFKYVPLFYAFFMSLFEYRIVNPPGTFVGFQNYASLLTSSYFWECFGNVLVFFLLYLGMTFWIPIMIALFINTIRRGNKLLRILYLIPSAIPVVSCLVLWKWMYNPGYGVFNYYLAKIGLGPFQWLNDPLFAKVAVVAPSMFGLAAGFSMGMNMLIYYSALQSIPEEILEAAKIDGAGPWQRIFRIILPNIRFIIGMQFIIFVSSVFLMFDPMFVMTQGGPVNSTRVLSLLIYNKAFGYEMDYGMAGAISCVMFLMIAVVTYIQLHFSRKGNQG